MSPEQARRLLARLAEYRADPESRLAALDDIQASCIEGITQEKLSVKDGVMTIIEKYPDVARRCVADKGQIAAELEAIANGETNQEMTLVINLEAITEVVP